ncbi:MAG TPA: AIR synthase-related protein, partial [Pyrinomonadaceae bacterium]|nr:AIR synthase-related protein [Pyrinomonadaceae bacterium]
AMTTSAAEASETMVRTGANACTDITGFGLLGHAYEMAKASDVSLLIESEEVPLLPDVLDLIRQGMLTRGDKNNRIYVGETVTFDSEVSGEMQSALFDPQTAGGLLISIEEDKAASFLAEVREAKIIGTVAEKGGKLIQVS